MRRLLYVLMGAALLTALPLFAIAYSDKPEAQVASLRPKISRTTRVQGDHLIAVTQLEPTQQTIDSVKASLVKHPAVLKYLNGTRNRLVSFEQIDQDTKATQNVPTPDRYRAAFYDYTNNRAFVARGRFDHSDIEVSESAEQPDPSEEEFQEAVAILSKDPKLGPSLQDKTTSAYQPMPPLINTGAKGDRVLGIGLFSRAGSIPHEVVGVNLVRGTIAAPGIRVCNTPPTTIIDTGSDTGNFLGVAIYDIRSEVTLVTEKSAGWYRYLSEYTFQDNGVIRPRYAFGATNSSCVCAPHGHHAYFRFDFDIRTPENNVIVENRKGTLSQLTLEDMRSRLFGSDHLWTVQNSVTGEAVTIRPGPRDGNWDKYARGDVWVLQFKSNEIDDGVTCVSGCDTRIQIHNFINGESIVNQDLVVWYGVHFQHHSDDTNTMGGPHVIGPDLILEKY